MFNEDIKLSQDIIEAYKRDKLVLFIGAGMSRLMGCQSWESLAQTLISRNFNFKEAKLLNNAHLSSKEKITIAYKQCEQNGNIEEFYEIMAEALKPNKEKEDIYKYIVRCKCLYVTTNADGILEGHHMGNRYSTVCTIDGLDGIKSPYLFYLHGRFGDNTEEDRKSLVFTVDEYLKRYSDPEYIEFLDYLFSSYVVLFIGYGMNEFELLDHLFSKMKYRGNSHYILEGFCSDMESLVEAKRMYYESLGIRLLTYCQDEDGYDRQYQIIKGWIEQLSEETFYESDILTSIKECLQEYNENNYLRLLHILSELDDDKLYLDNVLSNIPNSKDNYIYFEKLLQDGLISIDDCPKVVNSKDGYGYTAPYWNATDCILRIISQNVKSSQIQLLASNFLSRVIDKINSDEGILNNFHLRYTVISIILLLDHDYVNQKCIDFLCENSEYSSSSLDTVGTKIMYAKPGWLTWNKKYLNQVFNFILGHRQIQDKIVSNIHPYNLNKIYKIIRSLITAEQKKFILRLSIKNITKSFENIRYQFFDSFETQLQDFDFDYEKALNNIIIDLSKFIDRKMLKSLARTSSKKINIQFTLYLCRKTKADITILNEFKINPLDVGGTIADFYSYLHDYTHTIKENEVSNLIHLIKSATFGSNHNDSERETYINSCKLSLFSVLKEKNELFESEYNKLTNKKYIPDYNPVDWALEKVPHIISFHPDKVFEGNELETLSLVEMLNKVNNSKTYNRDIMYRESYEEIINYYIANNNLICLFEEITNNSKITFNDICCIIMALCQDKYKQHYNSAEILSEINKLISKIYNAEDSDDKIDLIKNILSILEYFFDNNACNEGLFSICLKIDTIKLWNNKVYDGVFNENDILGNMINDGECQLYLLLFSLIVNIKEHRNNFESNFEEFKRYFPEKILQNNKWFLLSCAHNFQNLFYLNNKWAKEITDSIFADNEYIADMIAVACRMSNYIMKELIDKIFNSAEQINYILNEADMTHDYKKGVIRYVVVAYLFGMINYEEYKTFLSYIQEEFIETVFAAIVTKTTSQIKNPVIETYIASYKILQPKINNSEIYSDIIRFAEDISNPDKAYWDMISDCLNRIDSTTHSWYHFDDLFNKNTGDNDFLYLESLYIYIEKFVPSDIDMIISVLDNLKLCSKKNEAIKLCNKLLLKKIFTDRINEYMKDLKDNMTNSD